MKKTIISILMILLSYNNAVYSGDEIIEKPESECETTEGEKGILTSLALMYVKVRECVKTAYDEIQYWKGITKSYQEIRAWFDDQKDNLNTVGRIGTDIFTHPGDVLANLEKAERLFDEIDNIALNETRRFDKLMCNYEYNLDHSFLTPNTDAVCMAIEGMLGEMTNRTIRIETGDGHEDIEVNNNEIYLNDLRRYQADQFPEYKIIKAGKEIVSESMSRSQLYFEWSRGPMEKLAKRNDSLINNPMQDLNSKQLYVSWLGIEEINANTKLANHQIEELKLYMTLLGYDLYERSVYEQTMKSNAASMESIEERIKEKIEDLPGDRNDIDLYY